MGASGAVAVRQRRTSAQGGASMDGGSPDRLPLPAPLGVIEFATRRLAASRPPLDALPGVLKRLTTDLDGQAALAFSLADDPLSFGVPAYPADAASAALLAELKALPGL